MTDFYLFLSSQDSLDVRKNNNSSDFWIQLPKTHSLEGQWLCALNKSHLPAISNPRHEDSTFAQIL